MNPTTPDPNANRTDISGRLLSTGQLPGATTTTPPPVTPATPAVPVNPVTPNTPDLSGVQKGVADAQAQAAKIQAELNGNKTPTTSSTSTTQTGTSTTGTQTTPNTTTTVNGVDTEAADRQALAQAQADYQKQADAVSSTILSIQNGSTPLNAGEQAQVDGLKSQFDALIKQQGLDNIGAAGAGNMRGYQSGAAEYDPTFQVKTIGAIVTAGANKVADLQVKEASAVATLTQALKTSDIQAVKDAYSVYQDASKARTDAIQKTIDDAAAAIKAAQDQKQKQTDAVNAIAEDLAKNGAPADILAKVTAAQTPADAITAGLGYFQDPTSPGGQYAAYVKNAQAQGLTPASPADFLSSQKAKDAYNSAYASESAKSQFTNSSANQDKLEQQYRNVILKELSNRSGGLGLQDAKVNQAIHLKALYNQYLDPATGNYNIPTAQYAELALGLANLVSPSGTTAEADRAQIKSKTAAGDIKGALSYITGTPQNGNTQAIIKNLVDSIDRQGTVAEDLRDNYVGNLHSLVPTDLDPSRAAALEQGTLASFTNDPKEALTSLVQTNPQYTEEAAKLMEVPGANPQDTLDYLNMKYHLQ